MLFILFSKNQNVCIRDDAYKYILRGGSTQVSYDGSMLMLLFGFIGIGGFLHSLIDYKIAFFVVNPLSKVYEIPVFQKAKRRIADR